MCKCWTKIKLMPFPSFRKGLDRQIDDVLVVKLNFKWSLFSLILCHNAAVCQKMSFFCSIFFLMEMFHGNCNFLEKAAPWCKIKEKRPHLKFNFTTSTSSIYLSRPFLKLGNGNRLTLVLLLHISSKKCELQNPRK